MAGLMLFGSAANVHAAEGNAADAALVERVKEAVIKELRESGALALLPLEGAEFGILSVVLLVVSLLLISKTLAEPAACPLARNGNAQQS